MSKININKNHIDKISDYLNISSEESQKIIEKAKIK